MSETSPTQTSSEAVPDTDLAARVQDGDGQAFDQLMRRHRDAVYRYLLARTGQREDAEDLTQATFLRAWKKRHLYRRGATYTPWLYTIACRLFASHYRKLKWKRLLTGSLDERLEKGFEPEHELKAHSWIWQSAAACLPEKHYLLLWLSYAEGRTCEEIAQQVGGTSGSVRVAIHRCREKLQHYLQQEGRNERSHSTELTSPVSLKGEAKP